MQSIMDLMSGVFRGETVDRLSSQLNAPRGAVERGVTQAVPLTVVGLAEHAQSEQGAKALLGRIRDGNYPQVDPAHFGQLISDPAAAQRTAQSSSGFLSSLFGNELGTLKDSVSSSSGLSRSSTGALFGLVTPLVMHWVGKQVTTRGLDARGLMGLLAVEGQKVSGHLPAGLSSLFKGGGAIEGPRERIVDARSGARERIGVAGSGAREVTHGTREQASDWPSEASQRRSRAIDESREHHPQRYDRGMNLRWLWLPLIALGLVLLWWGFRRPGREQQARLTAPEVNVQRPATPEPPPVSPAPTPPAPSPPATAAAPATAAGQPPAAPASERQPVAGKDVTVLSDDARPLSTFLDGNAPAPQRFVLEGVEFEAGSSRLTANPMLEETARILRAHPNAKVRIEGHTDREGTGARNQALSQQRADAVENYLVGEGVASSQLTAAGMSELNPIAGNDTPTGRADNRRVELIVTQR